MTSNFKKYYFKDYSTYPTSARITHVNKIGSNSYVAFNIHKSITNTFIHFTVSNQIVYTTILFFAAMLVTLSNSVSHGNQ